jgi:hypothetical protein
MIQCKKPYIQCPFYGEFWSAIVETLATVSSSPPRRCAIACAESTVLEGSPKTAAPFGAFIFTGGAPELAGINAQSQPNRLAVASRHRRPLPSQGELIEFLASPRCRRWKPYRGWWIGASVMAYSGEPPRSRRPYRPSRREPSIPALTTTIRLSDTPSHFINLSR